MRMTIRLKALLVSLGSQKGRVALVVITVVVATLGAMVAIAYAAAFRMAGDKVVKRYGIRNCRIFVPGAVEGSDALGLDMDDVRALQMQFGALATFSPVYVGVGVPARSSQASTSLMVVGVEPAYLQAATDLSRLRLGRLISDADNAQGRPVCVLTSRAVGELFPRGGSVIGQVIQLGSARLRVIGVLSGESAPARATVPPSVAVQRILGRKPLGLIAFWVNKNANIEELARRVRRFLASRQRNSASSGNALRVVTPGDMRRHVESGYRTTVKVTLLTSFVGIAIAFATVLLVMLSSLTRRRNELAIRRAMGASEKDLLRMIAAEYGLLMLAGIVMGILGSLPLDSLLRARASVAPFDIRHFVRFDWALGACVALSLWLSGLFFTVSLARVILRKQRANAAGA